MLPVVRGTAVTVRAIRHYSWVTVILSCLGALVLPSGGLLYSLLLLPFNARLLQLSARLSATPDDPSGARNLFRWSILYLFGICLLLVLARTPQAASLQVPIQLAAFPLLRSLGAA
jgi:protoheme IX farnesyltransferase